jgi:hypothetical protein
MCRTNRKLSGSSVFAAAVRRSRQRAFSSQMGCRREAEAFSVSFGDRVAGLTGFLRRQKGARPLPLWLQKNSRSDLMTVFIIPEAVVSVS